MSHLTIDHQDPRPPYEQIASSIVRMIADGDLAPGDALAPIRQLAHDLGLAPNTVARAYRELESIGLIASHGRRGTVVIDAAAALDTTADVERVDRLRTAVDEARAAGLTAADIVSIVSRRLLAG